MAEDVDEVARWRGRTWVVSACFVAFAAAVGAVMVTPGGDPMVLALVGDVVATLAVFAFSLTLRNTSVYDPYWSVAPPLIVAGWIVGHLGQGDLIRQGLVLAVVTAWGTRLTVNWLAGWPGLHHEDWRYVDIQRKTGLLYWPVSLLGLHLFPTLIVLLGLWPALEAIREPTPWQPWEAIGPAVVLLATTLEARADHQLRAFRQQGATGEVLQSGLWAWSRHPNYLGEMGVWWGLWLTAVLADWRHAPTVAGALAITAMFRFVSVPLIEARMVARRPQYALVQERVPMFVPWPLGARR